MSKFAVCIAPKSASDKKFDLQCGVVYKVTGVIGSVISLEGSNLNYSLHRFKMLKTNVLTKLEKLIYNLTNTNKGE